MPGESGIKVGYFSHFCLSCVLCVIQLFIYVRVFLYKGDRGFDGLPGLPGDKGYRVRANIH